MQDHARSIRRRLAALCAATTVAIVSPVVISGIDRARSERDAAEARVAQLAADVADDVGRHLGYLASLVEALARRGPPDLSDEGACGSWARAAEHVPRFASAMLVGPDGQPICTYGTPSTPSAVYADRLWFRAAMSADSLVLETVPSGRIQDEPLVILARRVSSDGRSLQGVTSIAVRLAALARWLHGASSLSERSHVAITTVAGTVLADSGESGLWDASDPPRLPDPGSGSSVAVIPTADGDQLLVSSRRVPATDWVVSVGLPAEEVLSTQGHPLVRYGPWALAVAALVTLVAWFAYRMIMTPLGGLVAGIRSALQEGRDHLPSPIPVELQELATWAGTALRRKKRAESRLAWLSQAAEQSTELIFITDHEGRFLYVNPVFERVTGYAKSEVVGTTPRILRSSAHGPEFYRALWATLLAGETFRGVVTNRTKSGELYLEEKTVQPIRDSRGRLTHFVSTGRDITAAAALESRVMRSERLEAVGRLVGGVAHDFNNLLTVIKGHARLLERDVPEGDAADAAGSVQKIIEGTEMAASLTRELLALGRAEPDASGTAVLDDEVRRVRNILERIFPADIRVDLRLSAPEAAVDVSRARAGQILMNLTLNARDAMAERGGTLTIGTSVTHVPAKIAWERPELAGRPCVLLEVSDTGRGMSTRVAEDIFEPYYSTKRTGSGLGLATVLGVIDDAGGVIDVQTTEGEGTTFRVYLPIEETSALAVAPRPSITSLRGSETIVLAEDEDDVRSLVADVLTRHGYEVLEASDGWAALTLVEALGRPVDLLVTNVMMPRMRGPELYQHMRASHADVPVVFISGYAEGGDVAPRTATTGQAFVQKPFDPLELLAEIRILLDAPEDH